MARNFNGSSDVIDAGNVCNITGTAITVCHWIYPTTLSVTTKPIGRWDDGPSAFQYLIAILNSNKAFWQTGGAGLNPSITGATVLSTNTWYHIAGVMGGTTGTLYVNGASDGTNGSWTNSITSQSIHLVIGAGADFPPVYDNFFAGRIADAGIWSVALSAAEIAALANGARPYTIRPGNLQGYWPLDGLQSPEPDLSGNAKNGTLTGTSLAAGPPTMLFTPRWPLSNVLPTTPPFNAAWAKIRNVTIEGVAT